MLTLQNLNATEAEELRTNHINILRRSKVLVVTTDLAGTPLSRLHGHCVGVLCRGSSSTETQCTVVNHITDLRLYNLTEKEQTEA